MEVMVAENSAVEVTIRHCHRIMRVATGVILAAFVLIIGMTTFSMGPVVQVLGKSLYYVILVSIFLSLGVWYYRTKIERRLVADAEE